MAGTYEAGAAGQIQRLLDGGTYTGLADARLLERFLTRRDEAAFAALVMRHGGMVRNTCRAVLRDPSAADDAFQATFVLLFRKAAAIRGGESLGGWLHRVAYRIALQAGSDAARRRDAERAAGALRAADSPGADDLGPIVHEEVERLPERLRLPIVLCDLQGLTREQAAERLGWTEGTLRGRLAKGRDVLRRRLARRELTLAVPLNPPPAVPESLVAATVKAVTAGPSTAAAALAAAVARAGMLGRWKAAAAVVLSLGAATAALVVLGGLALRSARLAGGPSRPTLPVEGRILDLEGRPVAGAVVTVKYTQSPPGDNLDAWIDQVKRLGRRPHALAYIDTGSGFGTNQKPSATSGRDGRFRIATLPRGSIATVSITGPSIETAEVYIIAEDLPTIRRKVPQLMDGETVVYYGAKFDHAAAPARPIVGTVRDKDSGAPIAGVQITGMPNLDHSMIPTPGVEATSDAAGRYEIRGLSLSRGFKLFTEAPAGSPYVNGGFVSAAGETGPGPQPFDLALKRGVLVRGRLVDKANGRPVRGSVQYFAFADNPYLDEFPSFKRGSQITRTLMPDLSGRFTIPVLPGRGLLTARAQEERYLHGVGIGAIKGYDANLRGFPTYPLYCSSADQHVLAEIDPPLGAREVSIDLQVDPGRSVTLAVVDPEGRSVTEQVEVLTLDVFQTPYQQPGRSSTYTITGLPRGAYRLDVLHRGRKLAAALPLEGDETGTLRVKLQPWGTVVGRVVDEEGNPRTDAEIFSTTRERFDPGSGDLRDKPTVDSQGRFRIEGLVPGVKYDALGHTPRRAYGTILKGVATGPGEVKDLGDITLRTEKDQED